VFDVSPVAFKNNREVTDKINPQKRRRQGICNVRPLQCGIWEHVHDWDCAFLPCARSPSHPQSPAAGVVVAKGVGNEVKEREGRSVRSKQKVLVSREHVAMGGRQHAGQKR